MKKKHVEKFVESIPAAKPLVAVSGPPKFAPMFCILMGHRWKKENGVATCQNQGCGKTVKL